MSEQAMRRQIVQALRGRDPISVENSAYPGTPDVNFIEGWAELKWLRYWPAKTESIVQVEHFTPQQRVWLLRRWRAGGNVWLLLSCEKTWLLFTGETAARCVGRVNRSELLKQAFWISERGLEENKLLEILTLGRTNETHVRRT